MRYVILKKKTIYSNHGMPRCNCCRKKNHLLMSCKWCVCDFCTICLAVESHQCANIESMKEHHLKKLKEDLIKHKTVGVKVIKI
jgi:hypothetical protein